ncbi:MAG: DUF4253 domain-containing protein [Gloeomargaritaceae cyanobacterium C42_A2020_066]|nr:DUF4253 domain-containing protein [Gloeomargaritaceae cyanobacterium C42_A2020_066]
MNWKSPYTQRRFGVTPAIEHPEDFLTSQHIHSHFGLERCFFEWERHNVADALALKTDDLTYLDWFDAHADGLVLLLMPSPRSWEGSAYIHWFGSESHSSQLTVAMLHHWHLRYGAELVAHYGTMLELITTRLPETPEEALQLAWEQETLAPCTTLLPGVCLRDHARSLLHTHRWFLHERP